MDLRFNQSIIPNRIALNTEAPIYMYIFEIIKDGAVFQASFEYNIRDDLEDHTRTGRR